jgi:hypothetical protein
MSHCSRTIHQITRVALWVGILSACTAGYAWAQQDGALAQLNVSGPLYAAADAAAQAAPVTPAAAAAASDSALLSFFRSIELSGFIDGYYSYNFNKPGTGKAGVERTFDIYHNSFSLSMAELALEKKPTSDSRGGFRLDLDYGQTQTLVNAAEPGDKTVLQNIGQAYVSYLMPAGSGLQFDFGKFVTPLGYETIKAKDNWNYSRGLLFTNAIPFYHMGVRATYNVNNNFSLAGYLVNGWNDVVDNNTGKTGAVQVTVKPTGALAIIETYIFGPEQAGENQDKRWVSDTVATFTVTPQFSLAGNYDYGQDKETGAKVKWQGIAGYARIQPTSWFALSPRAEFYNDTQGFTLGMAQKIKEITVTGELKSKDGFLFRMEYRRDFSDIPFFLKNASTQVKNQNTFTAAVIYAFSTKAP